MARKQVATADDRLLTELRQLIEQARRHVAQTARERAAQGLLMHEQGGADREKS